MTEFNQLVVIKMADHVRKCIVGGFIFGVPVTENDIDAMLAAAFYMGRDSGKKFWEDDKPESLWFVKK